MTDKNPYRAYRAYRIVEISDGKVKSLFHGTSGSRTLPVGEWIKADKKMVHDGSHGIPYRSGFHFLWGLAEAQDFFEKRFRDKENRYVVACWVRGNIRIKNKKANPPCWLADEILFFESDMPEIFHDR